VIAIEQGVMDLTALAGSSGSPDRSTAPGDGREETEPLFTATGWTTSDLAGVTAFGELDLASAPLLAAAIDSVCRRGTSGAGEFLLDLEGVTFLDSVGLRAAGRAERAARNWGWQVQLVWPTARGPRRLMMLSLRRGVSVR
jgi:anti-anti-sigma factor